MKPELLEDEVQVVAVIGAPFEGPGGQEKASPVGCRDSELAAELVAHMGFAFGNPNHLRSIYDVELVLVSPLLLEQPLGGELGVQYAEWTRSNSPNCRISTSERSQWRAQSALSTRSTASYGSRAAARRGSRYEHPRLTAPIFIGFPSTQVRSGSALPQVGNQNHRLPFRVTFPRTGRSHVSPPS